MTDNPERIYLQHKDAIDPTIGRVWCADKDVFDTEGHEPTEYARADVVERLRLALKFYADPINHARTQENHPQSVCAQDAGLLARAALKRSDVGV